MHLYGKISVKAEIPEQLERLKDIAYNMWWSWNSDAIDLYREIDLPLWEKLDKNPVKFLNQVSRKKLDEKLKDPNYMKRYHEIIKKIDTYMSTQDTWFNKKYPNQDKHKVAYFSAEYGINEVLPIYSGGLGVLSGDHCKSASDLGIPFVAVGLFYKQGYFSQKINEEGWQDTVFTELNVSDLPIKPALKDNNQVIISVELPGRIVYAKVWEVKIGRISLYLMDADLDKNNSQDRMLTARLYGGDKETRIQQEIFLGIGGIRVLKALGIDACVYHMNEGHSSFLGLELIRDKVQNEKLSFNTAREIVSSSVVFTTHTPVPAGNDVFPLQMIDNYFSNYWPSLEISRHEFLDLGMRADDPQNFNMTVLALNMAGKKNGVSSLHGEVSRNIFKDVWPGVPKDEVPIGHITNGIHTLTWLSPNIKRLYDEYFAPNWEEELYKKETWDNVDNIPDEELWNAHNVLKLKMINFIREKIKHQRISNGEPIEKVREADSLLDPNVFTIGFARRFATYKRADLIFKNLARIEKILNNSEMPLQIIFAGKAHPADKPAHEIIKSINDIAKRQGFEGKVVLIENYNMTLARNLVQGVDVWLNNPRRPLEASGTSGQKVCINGIINFSILDGWWCEGYNGKNGWVIGDETFYDNEESQDNADSNYIYEMLENKIIPMFYDRDENGVPIRWVHTMKESIKSVTPVYSTHRMVQEYTESMYLPLINRVNEIRISNYKYAEDLAKWKLEMVKKWPQVHIVPSQTDNNSYHLVSGDSLKIHTKIYLGDINPEDVKVQLYYGYGLEENHDFINPQVVTMEMEKKLDDGNYCYVADISILEGGEYGYTFRVLPYHKDLINDAEMKLIRWFV